MEKFSLTPSFLFFIFLAFLFQSSNGSTLIRESCMKASNWDSSLSYDFCVSFLEANVKTEPTNITMLTSFALKLGRSAASDIVSKIPKLLNDPKFSAIVKTCLKDCSSMYNDAVSGFKDAEHFVETKDFLGANIQVSTAMDASTNCEDQFGEEGEKSPLTDDNNRYRQITVMCLTFTSMCREGA